MQRRQRVHDLAQVGRPAGSPTAGLVGAARAQQAMAVGPPRNCKLRIRRAAVAPGAQQVERALEADIDAASPDISSRKCIGPGNLG